MRYNIVTVLSILGAVGFAISVAIYSFGHHKIASLWVLLASLLVWSFVLYRYLKSRVSKDAKLEQPAFPKRVETVTFSLGEKGMSVSYKFVALEREAKEPYNFSGYSPVRLYIEKRKLYVDAKIHGGSGLPPIEIKRNQLLNKPDGWDFNSNKGAMEVVDENHVPMYQLYYKTDSHVVVNGILPFPGGLVLVKETGVTLNPILPTTFRLECIFKYPSWKYPGQEVENSTR